MALQILLIWKVSTGFEPLVKIHFSPRTSIYVQIFFAYLQAKSTCLFFFFFKFLEDMSPFCGATDTLCLGLLMTSPLGFKARMDPSLACFVPCLPWIPEIHLWCNNCWLYRGQHGSWPRSLHACSRGRLLGFNQETSRIVSEHAVHSATATGRKIHLSSMWALGVK